MLKRKINAQIISLGSKISTSVTNGKAQDSRLEEVMMITRILNDLTWLEQVLESNHAQDYKQCRKGGMDLKQFDLGLCLSTVKNH